jgi:hypothetical protein
MTYFESNSPVAWQTGVFVAVFWARGIGERVNLKEAVAAEMSVVH